MVGFYKGFLWNFEDTQFVVLDSQRGAIRSWWSLYARLNNQFSMRMKYTMDHHKTVNNIEFADTPTAKFLKNSSSYYYVEFNYNF